MSQAIAQDRVCPWVRHDLGQPRTGPAMVRYIETEVVRLLTADITVRIATDVRRR
ncbi:MAG: hypothetical protein PVS2B1_18820 [Candidatus Dormibacteraceae bacterium]